MPRDNDQECGIQAVITGVTVTCHRIRRHDGPHASSTYGTRWRDTGEVLTPPPVAPDNTTDLHDDGLLAVARPRRTTRTTGGAAVKHFQPDYARVDPAKTHRCCVTSCPAVTLLGYLACRRHWGILPADIRRDLAAAFRQREKRPELYAEAVIVAERLINLAAAGAA